ncbi:MAG: outer membrane beta-barrel protein [Bacteroidetes bacterium]|nr:outer membrane beta-barrel protein [Bacteroidota bacterium]
MKNTIAVIAVTLLVLMLSAFNAQAQYATGGVVELGGAISFSSSKMVANGETADQSTTLFQCTPYVSYFLVNGFSIGLVPGINIIKIAGSESSIKIFGLFASPGFTFNAGGKVYPYINGMVGYTAAKSDASPIPTLGAGELDLKGVSFGGKAGIKFGIGNGGLAAIGASYMAFTLKPKDADKRSGLNNLAFSLGYSVYF